MALPVAFTCDPTTLATGSYTGIFCSTIISAQKGLAWLLVIVTGYGDPGDRSPEPHLDEKAASHTPSFRTKSALLG